MTSLSRSKSDDKERSLHSTFSRISLTSTLTYDDDSYSLSDSLAGHSASRMERIADHDSSTSSFPMMPQRIGSVCRRPAAAAESNIHTHTATAASEARHPSRGAMSSTRMLPASSRSHHSMPVPVPVCSSGFVNTARGGGGGSARRDSSTSSATDPPLAPQRLVSMNYQPRQHLTTQSSALAPISPQEEDRSHQMIHRQIPLPPSSPMSSKDSNSFQRLPLKRVSPRRRREEHHVDMKAPAPHNDNDIHMTGSSSISTKNISQEQQQYPPPAPDSATHMTGSSSISTKSTTMSPSCVRAHPLHAQQEHPVISTPSRDHRGRDDIFGPPPMPKRHQSRRDLMAPAGVDYDEDDHHDQKEQDQKQEQEQQDCNIMIDVAPGVKMPLRGSVETWSAVEEGNVTVTLCVCCNMDLNCIFDAQLVICPDCLCVSPVDQTEQDSATSTASLMHRHGVGVGIKAEEILRWVMSNSE